MNIYLIIWIVYFVIINTDGNLLLVSDLINDSVYETTLNEELARLLDIDYDRQGSCDNAVATDNCVTCAYSGVCYNGGFCCELNKVRIKMLKPGQRECPKMWSTECRMTSTILVSTYGSSKEGNASRIYPKNEEFKRLLDMSAIRLMCVCYVHPKQCCSDPTLKPMKHFSKKTTRFYYFNYNIKTTPTVFQ